VLTEERSGVLTHYVLAGTIRGIASFYPLPREYIGIPVTSRFALAVTLCVTAVEIMLVFGVMQLAAPIDAVALPLSF
jgi:hypothetical protein